MLRRLVFLIGLPALVMGCARIQTSTETSKLPRTRLSADAVALDVAFIHLPIADELSYEVIWTAADEQLFPATLRQDLSANGFRVGVIGQQLPPRLRELLDVTDNILEAGGEDLNSPELNHRGAKRHLQIRAGRRSEILASKTYPALAALVKEDGRLHGHQFREAQCQFALKQYPQGDGRVKIELIPEIAHGEPKTQWVGSEGSIMPQVGRERLVLDLLRIESQLVPGEWLLLSATDEIRGLGEHFFTQTSSGKRQRTFLLIRVSQTQLDDLFAPEQTSAPLATPTE